LPRLKDYDCVIFGTSRATLLPEDKATEYRCFNLAISDGQASEYLIYADYLLKRGFAPRLLIVDIRRDDLIGPVKPPDVPDFVATGDTPPSIFATYLSLELHPERADLYIQLRQKFPAARAIAYLPPESAWRIAAFSLTGVFDPYLSLIGNIAAAYDRFLDFSFPSPLTESKAPADTYDGSHYSREVNERVLAALLADKSDLAVDWRRDDASTIAALYHQRIAQFISRTTPAKASSAR
jgi:hypothetical protein